MKDKKNKKELKACIEHTMYSEYKDYPLAKEYGRKVYKIKFPRVPSREG